MGLLPCTFLLGLLLLLGRGKSTFCSSGNQWLGPAGVPRRFAQSLGEEQADCKAEI